MSRGYTLLELLVALALVAVLATTGYPGFSAWVLDSRRDAIVMTTMHAVQFARQFAAARSESAELCGTLDALHCSGGGDWSRGMLIVGANGAVHRSIPASKPDNGPEIRSNRFVIRFEPGTSFASPATMTICDRRGSKAARAVIVSRSGRPRVSNRDSSNRKLQC
jgi:type IV fimbrial biogenesis protein FimT